MGREHEVRAGRVQPVSAQRRQRADDPVDHHRQPVIRCSDIAAGERRDIEAADLRDDIYGVGRIGLIQRERRLNDFLLMDEPFVRQAAALAHDFVRGQAGERHAAGAGGTGVADAHLAVAQQFVAFFLAQPHHVDAGQDALDGLLAGHGRAFREVVRTVRDVAVDHEGAVHPSLDPDIHDLQVRAGIVGQHAHAGHAFGDVLRVIAGHLLGRACHALLDDAVVRREDEHAALLRRVDHLAGDARHLDRDGLEPPEAAQGLQKPVVAFFRGFDGRPVRAGDSVQIIVESHKLSFFYHSSPNCFRPKIHRKMERMEKIDVTTTISPARSPSQPIVRAIGYDEIAVGDALVRSMAPRM